MTDLGDVVGRLRAALPGLREQWPIRSLALFGSRIRDDATPDSDLDVLVEFERPIPLSAFLAFKEGSPPSRDCGLIWCRPQPSNPISANGCEPRPSSFDGGLGALWADRNSRAWHPSNHGRPEYRLCRSPHPARPPNRSIPPPIWASRATNFPAA